MICRENKEQFIMVTQHQHGLLAGQIAAHFHSPLYESSKRKEEVHTAIEQHDRGWISLDDTPFWNDVEEAPYTFIDFPLAPRLTFYRKGLDEIEGLSSYAGLLCSLHFEKLLLQADLKHPSYTAYMEHEERRRDRIQRELGITDLSAEGELIYHLWVLQFCDDLSLYLCLNEPGVSKDKEFIWWRDGFGMSDRFDFTEGKTIQAQWLDQQTVSLDPFPFREPTEVHFYSRIVPKQTIAAKGLAKAYEDADTVKHTIWLVPIKAS